MDQRPVRGQGVARGAERGGDDHAVGAYEAHVLVVHEDMDGQHAGDGSASHDHVVGGVPLGYDRAVAQEFPRQQDAGAGDHLSGEEAFQTGSPVVGRQFGQKADLTEVDAEKRNVDSGELAPHADERAVPAEDQHGVRRAGPVREFRRRAGGGDGGGRHAARFEPSGHGDGRGLGGGMPGLGDEKNGGYGLHLLSVVETL